MHFWLARTWLQFYTNINLFEKYLFASYWFLIIQDCSYVNICTHSVKIMTMLLYRPEPSVSELVDWDCSLRHSKTAQRLWINKELRKSSYPQFQICSNTHTVDQNKKLKIWRIVYLINLYSNTSKLAYKRYREFVGIEQKAEPRVREFREFGTASLRGITVNSFGFEI